MINKVQEERLTRSMKIEQIKEALKENSRASLTELSKKLNIPTSTIYEILKEEIFPLYKFTLQKKIEIDKEEDHIKEINLSYFTKNKDLTYLLAIKINEIVEYLNTKDKNQEV